MAWASSYLEEMMPKCPPASIVLVAPIPFFSVAFVFHPGIPMPLLRVTARFLRVLQ